MCGAQRYPETTTDHAAQSLQAAGRGRGWRMGGWVEVCDLSHHLSLLAVCAADVGGGGQDRRGPSLPLASHRWYQKRPGEGIKSGLPDMLHCCLPTLALLACGCDGTRGHVAPLAGRIACLPKPVPPPVTGAAVAR